MIKLILRYQILKKLNLIEVEIEDCREVDSHSVLPEAVAIFA